MTDYSEKITAGANWYPLPHLNFSAQYYHKIENSNYGFDTEESSDQNASSLDFNTDDANVRATWKPLKNLSVVSRYDFEYSTIYSRWMIPAQVYEYGMSSRLQNHVFSECVTWNPIPQMYIQGNASYVLNQTHTPASDNVIPGFIQDGKNDYWTLGYSTGVSLDEKTELKGDLSYYRATDYQNNESSGMPYGDNAEEYTASLALSRQVSETVRVTLKYGYYRYTDNTYGDLNNYEAHLIYASTRIQF
jgi:hypothetical protein